MNATGAVALKAGENCFTLAGLMVMAAKYKGLKFQLDSDHNVSEPLGECFLDEKTLDFLASRKIVRQSRPDCNHEIFTLVDENPQQKVQGWTSSNYWNFRQTDGKFDLRVSLQVALRVNYKKRGVIMIPFASATCVSPADGLPNFRMFKALVECGNFALPPVAKEIAESDGEILVGFNELGLGGLRSVSILFEEFACGKEAVLNLAHSRSTRFQFIPEPYPVHSQPADELFIAEPAQPTVMEAWRKQLEEYRFSLTV